MPPDGSSHREVVALFGGQGTINVNSWSPDGRRFAFVAYPIEATANAIQAAGSFRPDGAVTRSVN